MQRIGSAGTSAAADPQTHRQPPRQLRRSLILGSLAVASRFL
jgi:hypothetical protein